MTSRFAADGSPFEGDNGGKRVCVFGVWDVTESCKSTVTKSWEMSSKWKYRHSIHNVHNLDKQLIYSYFT